MYQQGIIITTSDFSKGAREEAAAPNKTRIGLLNGQDLLELLIRHKVGVVEKALKVISLDGGWWGELAGPAAPAAAMTAPEPAPVDLADPPDLEHGKPRAAAKKPASFTFLGQSHAVASWPHLLVTLCQIMAERHPDDFVARALTVRGPRRSHIASIPDGMINPAPIGVADLWLEANQSSRTAQRVAQLITEAFGYADNDLHIVIQL